MKTYEDFIEMVKVIEADGYKMKYNAGSGEFINESGDEIITIYDYLDDENCCSD